MRKAPTTQLSAGENNSIDWEPTRNVELSAPTFKLLTGSLRFIGSSGASQTRHTTPGVEGGPGSLMHFLRMSIIFLHKTQQNASGWL